MIGLATSWIAFACLAAAVPGDRNAAKAAFDQAMHQYNLGRFEQALALFEQAYEAAPLPDLLFNMAQCHRNLGKDGEAIFFFERYLAARPNAPDAEQVRLLVEELRKRPRPPPVIVTSTLSSTAAPARLAIEPTITVVETEPSIVERWWFWAAIAVGIAAIVGGAALVARAGQSGLPDDPIATFDYRDL